MKIKAKTTSGSEELRRRAEERLTLQATDLKQLSPEEVQALVHELQVHQVELEMQNEQLCQTQAELETALTRYTDLYDFAPVAYLTLDDRGWILEANLTASRLLGTERSRLVQQPLAPFIRPEDIKQFWAYLVAVVHGQPTPPLELTLLGKGGAEVAVQLDSLLVPDAAGHPRVRTSLVDITARRRAEESRKNQMRFTETLLETIPSPVFYKDASGRYLGCNRAFEEFWGKRREEVIGKDVYAMGPKEIADKYAEMDQELFERPASQMYEWQVQVADGSKKEVIFYKASFLDASGKVGGLVGVILDITHRKRAEEALSESAELYRSLFENMLNGFAYCKMLFDQNQPQDFIYLSVNSSFEALTGLKNVVGKKASEVIPGIRESDQELLKICGRVALTGKPDRVEIYVEALKMWFSLSVYSLEKEYFVAVFDAITDRKLAEETLRVSEERYRSLVANTINAVALHEMLYDSEGRPVDYRFLMVNSAFEKLTGFSSEQVVDKTVLQVLPGLDPFWIETYGQVVVTGAPVAFERYEENLKRHFLVTAYKTEANQFGAIFSDITEQRELEGQFLQAQKMEAVGRLAGGVAHDFNNMLGVILGYCDLMSLKFHQDDPLTRSLSEIRKAADRAADLTRQLLAFSRKQMLTPLVLNLNDQLAGMHKMVERLIGEDIEIAIVLDPSLALVKADPGQIEQIIMNLVVNARDAMPQGGKLTMETSNVYLDEGYTQRHAYVTPGHYVMLAMTDNGQGMDAEMQARIFEPFFTTKEVDKGTGLGLSTVYGIVKQSGGHIRVYSEIGQGTTFKVYLPQVLEAVSAIPETKPVAKGLHGSETILVVEDNDMLRELIGVSLDMYGYKVLEASHGGEAFLLCEQHHGPIHLMLTDVVMPRMSGRELAERLAPLRPDMKVLYMSGYTENAIVHHGVLDSSFSFIQKPFSPTALMEKVRKILDEAVRQF